MKNKHPIICAALFFPVAAFAQSSVTLYGVLDTNVNLVTHVADAKGQSSSKIAMGNSGEWGSRFGFRGIEDLGGGYATIFTLEQGFNSNDGTATDSTRQFSRLSFVGITSPYGAITLGRQYTAMFDTIASFWPQTRSPMWEPYAAAMSIYADNAIKYTGNYGNFKFVGTASLGGVAGNFSASNAYSVGLTYASGPLAVAVSADQTNTAANTVAPLGSVGKTAKFDVAARYQIGAATLFGGFNFNRVEAASTTTTQRDQLYWTGVKYEFTPSIIGVLSYYYENLQFLNGTHPAHPQEATLHGAYFLSKSTNVYAAVSHTWNSALNFAAVSTLATGQRSQTGVTVGIRHLF